MIRTFLLFLIAFLTGIFIQGTFLHSLVPDAVAPDILLMLVVFLGLRSRTSWGALGAFLVGLGADFATAKFLGPFAAGSVVAFLVTVFISNHLFSEKAFTVGMVASLACLSKDLVAGLLLYIYTDINLFTLASLKLLFFESLLTAIFCPIVIDILSIGQSITTYGTFATKTRRP